MFYPEGVYVAMLTPFSEDGSVNESELRKLVDFCIEKGVDGLFPVSTIGEFVHMTAEEKVRMMEVVVDQAKGRVKVAPGIGSSHPAHSIELAKEAERIGCDAVVVAPPYYYKLSPEMVEKYFETIALASNIPIVLYNIPMFTQPIGYDTVDHLCRIPNIVGMKDSSGSLLDFVHFMDKVRVAGEKMHFMTGREDIFYPSLVVGGMGCMTGTAGILPEVPVATYKAFKEGDHKRALELQNSLLYLIRAMFSAPFPVGFKAALEARGFEMGPLKQPLSDAEEQSCKKIKAGIEKTMKTFLKKLDKGELPVWSENA